MANRLILNMKTLDLLGELNLDPVYRYEAISTKGHYELKVHWYEDAYGYFSKTLFSTKSISKLNKLLHKELHRLCK